MASEDWGIEFIEQNLEISLIYKTKVLRLLVEPTVDSSR